MMTDLQPSLLLISNSTNPGESYLDHCADLLAAHFHAHIRIAFVPYALADWDGYATQAERRFADFGVELRSVHREAEPVAAIRESDGVFVGGGNTFRLLKRCRELGLLRAIREAALSGAPYAGASAGSNLACPTIKTTNDMPIVDPGGLDALGLFPMQINPHYVDRDPDVAHGGETREQRIAEFHEEDPTPVIGLREGSLLEHKEGATRLFGPLSARLFLPGQPAQELVTGSVIEEFVVSK